MSKYDALEHYLRRHRGREVPMSFAEIERVLGFSLPPSAYKHRPWWANDITGHVHAKAWLSAGFHTERVDMDIRRVVFAKGELDLSPTLPNSTSHYDRHPLLGLLKGLGKASSGVDLTEPADPEWGKDGDRAEN